jgi:hypothetical protein
MAGTIGQSSAVGGYPNRQGGMPLSLFAMMDFGHDAPSNAGAF